jgi:RNA polymerase sigma-70 factor (ECF subfamily)
MPPLPEEYQGHDAIARFFAEIAFARHPTIPARTDQSRRPTRPRPLRTRPHAGIAHAHGLTVVTLHGDRITHFTAFLDTGLFPRFGLPRTVTD